VFKLTTFENVELRQKVRECRRRSSKWSGDYRCGSRVLVSGLSETELVGFDQFSSFRDRGIPDKWICFDLPSAQSTISRFYVNLQLKVAWAALAQPHNHYSIQLAIAVKYTLVSPSALYQWGSTMQPAAMVLRQFRSHCFRTPEHTVATR
jgi:hypothetical protein